VFGILLQSAGPPPAGEGYGHLICCQVVYLDITMAYLDYFAVGNKRVAAGCAGEAAGLLFEAGFLARRKGLLPAAQLFSFCLFLKSGPVHTATPWPGPEGGGDDYSAFPQLGPKFYILALSFPLSIKTNSGNWGPIELSDSIGTASIPRKG
jgi:hypothetical protein